jgi:hypothetical protein
VIRSDYFVASLCSVFPDLATFSPPPSSGQVGTVHNDAGGATTALAAVALTGVVAASRQRVRATRHTCSRSGVAAVALRVVLGTAVREASGLARGHAVCNSSVGAAAVSGE